ncbi:hypothetical protein ADIS_1956 [Lunatimonas lonarensis]|uniref:Cytochrome c domain-containing protein n=2 Tax=Lunatimonas lonarensis TaxID=1232681 RepID=R7ZU25_9BACT|nr:hypothetical protein ADIS_1956 [Lunatimonas lonarensis]
MLLLFWLLVSTSLYAQEEALERGAILARSYCSTCHAYASPDLLPKRIWKSSVLPQMAALMGFREAQDSLGVWEKKSKEEIEIVKSLGVYPSSSLISHTDFREIMDFYNATAPEELPNQAVRQQPERLKGFSPKSLFIEGIKSPKTSMVAINEEREELFISDATTNQLYVKVLNDELFTLPEISSPAVQFIRKAPNVYQFLTIGSIAPSDLAAGALYEMDLNVSAWSQVLQQLKRPVDGVWASIFEQGRADLVISNYGHNGGNLSVYRGGAMASVPIRLGGPGARRVEVVDLNRDGKPDIVALFCQGDERISVFYNLGGGNFGPEKVLLRFAPVMGSSYFEMHDFTGDGALDLLVSNGDNWDYSAVPKPYHGFRIYENLGNDEFREAWFYPQYGAAKAMAVDFDGDGDLDLATIAFYDELDRPEEQFLLFENLGGMNFRPYYVPEAAGGKWLTMDVGDLDGDGDVDIVLGAYLHNTLEYSKLLMRGVSEIPSVLILENKP